MSGWFLNRPTVARSFGWMARLPIAALLVIVATYRRGGASVVRQHDVLDFLFPIMHRMSFGEMFAMPNARVDFVLGGLPRGMIGSEFHIGFLTAWLLPTFWALLVSEILIRTLAFAGMRLVLRQIGLEQHPVIVWGTASLFSILPFYVPGFGAIAGVPLLIWAFLRVYDLRVLDRRSAFTLMAFPLFAGPHATLAYLVPIGLVAGCLGLAKHAAARQFFKSAALFVAAIFVVDWKLFLYSAFGATSHRADMVGQREFSSSIWEGVPADVVAEVSHADAGKSTILGVLLFAGLLALLWGRAGDRLGRYRSAAALCSVGMGLGIAVKRLWPVLESKFFDRVGDGEWARFQLSRVRWAEPALLYVLLAISLAALVELVVDKPKIKLAIGAILGIAIFAQSTHVISLHPFRAAPNSLSIDAYYARSTMAELRAVVEEANGDRVVSVALHPALTIEAGFDTADGYWSSYPLDYKVRFRRLIAPGLELSDSNRKYYDNWGSRVYAFVPEARPSTARAPNHADIELAVDATAWFDLAITHVISSGVIVNADDVQLTYVTEASAEDELGVLYLYEVQG